MSRHKVLVVDDHPLMRTGIAQLLEHDAELELCCEAGGRDEILALLDTCQPDAVILDISLGKGKSSGLDLIPDIHARAGRIPILVLSMLDEDIYAERARAAGASGYLSKQAPVQQIRVALLAVLRGEPFFPKAKSAPAGGQPSAAPGLDALSSREFEVFRLLGEGMAPRSIARQLGLSVSTIEMHRYNIRKKLKISSAEDLTRHAVNWFRNYG